MWASRVSMAHKRSSRANNVRISASGTRLSTGTPSSAAAYLTGIGSSGARLAAFADWTE